MWGLELTNVARWTCWSLGELDKGPNMFRLKLVNILGQIDQQAHFCPFFHKLIYTLRVNYDCKNKITTIRILILSENELGDCKHYK